MLGRRTLLYLIEYERDPRWIVADAKGDSSKIDWRYQVIAMDGTVSIAPIDILLFRVRPEATLFDGFIESALQPLGDACIIAGILGITQYLLTSRPKDQRFIHLSVDKGILVSGVN